MKNKYCISRHIRSVTMIKQLKVTVYRRVGISKEFFFRPKVVTGVVEAVLVPL